MLKTSSTRNPNPRCTFLIDARGMGGLSAVICQQTRIDVYLLFVYMI